MTMTMTMTKTKTETNLYIDLELFLDPAITDADALEKDLGRRINVWNKQINTPGSKYKRMVQRANEIIPQLKGLNLPTLAREARVVKMEELRDKIKNLKFSGDITEDVFRKKLESKYSYFFKEETIRRECGLPPTVGTTGKVVSKPPRPRTWGCATPVPFSDMKSIAEDLSRVVGNPQDLYELLGLSRYTTTTNELYEKSKEENSRNQRQTNKTPEVDSKNRLYGRCITYFKDNAERAKYDTALDRFRFDLLAENVFEDRCVKGTISPMGYYISVLDTIDEGYKQDEAVYLVYEFYILKKKCPPPEEYIPPVGGTVCISPTFNDFMGRLINLVHESEKYNNANPIGNELSRICKKLVELRQSTHLSDMDIQCEIEILFQNLEEWRRNDQTYTKYFWAVTYWNQWLELDVDTLNHADKYPDTELETLKTFYLDITILLGTIGTIQ